MDIFVNKFHFHAKRFGMLYKNVFKCYIADKLTYAQFIRILNRIYFTSEYVRLTYTSFRLVFDAEDKLALTLYTVHLPNMWPTDFDFYAHYLLGSFGNGCFSKDDIECANEIVSNIVTRSNNEWYHKQITYFAWIGVGYYTCAYNSKFIANITKAEYRAYLEDDLIRRLANITIFYARRAPRQAFDRFVNTLTETLGPEYLKMVTSLSESLHAIYSRKQGEDMSRFVMYRQTVMMLD